MAELYIRNPLTNANELRNVRGDINQTLRPERSFQRQKQMETMKERNEEAGRGVGGRGIHLSPWVH